jgi:hypothetical protein
MCSQKSTVAYGWLAQDHETTLKSYKLQAVIVT